MDSENLYVGGASGKDIRAEIDKLLLIYYSKHKNNLELNNTNDKNSNLWKDLFKKIKNNETISEKKKYSYTLFKEINPKFKYDEFSKTEAGHFNTEKNFLPELNRCLKKYKRHL